LRRRPRGRGFGHWGAAAAAAAVAIALPFAGSWASADRDSPGEPVAQPRAKVKPKPRVRHRPAARRRESKAARRREARAARKRVAVGAFVPNGTRRPSRFARYARMTGRRPAILLYFRSWRVKHAFDELTLDRIANAGAVPMLTWEPRRTSLAEIGAGRFDRYIRAQARDARHFRRPVLIRFAHEMNGDWYSWGAHLNSPAVFIRAWRRIVEIFRDERARNARFVWSPNADSEGLARIRRYYPGDDWVDWVGLSGFSWGGPWDWEGASDIFRSSYRLVTRMTGKPVMIAETAASEIGGDKAKWIDWTFRVDLPRMPRVRAVIWFNGHEDWANWHVNSSRASLRAFRFAVTSPRYSGTAKDVEQGGRDT
jgi:mannan endo-1,4-beta-mannosidase